MDNMLTGPLPTEYNNHTLLQSVNLQHNLLSQHLPPKLFNETLEVYSIYLHDNLLTGTIPEAVAGLDWIVELDLHNNHLTGEIPEGLRDIPYIDTLALDGNMLSGEIPVALGAVTQLQSLFLFNNLLTGTIAPQLNGMIALTVLGLNDNLLSGSIPRSLSQLSNLNIFFVQNNILSGCLDGVFDPYVQNNLKYVDVSKNQISGTIPVELFQIKLLNSFSAVSNCFTGSIPKQICDCRNLSTLALDGLMSATSCQMKFFPSWTSSYGLPNSIQGGMPECLFAMPNMLSLHLSGNGLTGTIPSDLVISSSMVDLSLSHNNLKGEIPFQMQTHNWSNLDLSYNKFRGTLDSDIYFTYGNNGSLSLQVNRLSGVIPPSLHTAEHITILDGNLYECDTSRNDLPEHDSYRDIYECGSNAFNYSLYVWLVIVLTVGLCACLVYCYWFRHSVELSFGATILEMLKSWFAVFSPTGKVSGMFETVPRLTHLLAFGTFVAAFRSQILRLTTFIVVVCLPLYLVLSTYYDMYTYEYAWSASGCYLSGTVPSGLMFMVFLAFCALVVRFVHQMSSVIAEESEYPVVETKTDRRKWTYFECAQVGLLVLFNLVLVTAINIGYVYVDHNYTSGIVRATQISVALFKIVWKNLIVRLLLRFSSPSKDDGKDATTGPDLSLAVFVTIFNNIAAPFIATCYVSSDCFYNVVSSPPKVKVSYEYLSCLYGSFDHNVTTCYTFDNMKLTQTSYDPPFVYSFQCSSTFVTTYSSVYVLMLTFEAFAVPLVMWLLAGYHSWVSKKKDRNHLLLTLESAIPKILQTIVKDDAVRDDGESERLTTKPANEAPYFECAVFVVKLVNMFSILSTFGVILPPIAVVCCVAVLSASVNMQLFIGRLVTNALDSGSFSILTEVDADCQHSSDMFLGSLWALIPFVCIFFAIILFDTLGDSVGWKQALWAPVMLLTLPILLWYTYKAVKAYNPSLLEWRGSERSKRRSSGCVVDSAGEELQRHVSASGVVVYTSVSEYSPLRLTEDEVASKALIPCEDSVVMNTIL